MPLILPVFTATLFSSAMLLFVVEPMLAKMALPLLGSTPAVWTTSVMFFQAVLLAGYGYAHLSMKYLGVRRQIQLHVALLILPLAALPLHLPRWTPPSSGSPVLWLLLVLTVSVGLPFFVVSATSPLLQSWFSHTGHRHAPDPYFLYRASNLGSMVALLGYPILIEPHLRLTDQSNAWSFGYALVCVLLVATAVTMSRLIPGGTATIAIRALAPDNAAGSSRLPWRRRLRWVALAAVPATWMLALTSYLTTGLAPVPLLWVIPLALYLLSFTIVFATRPMVSQTWLRRALPFLIIPLVGTLQLHASGPLWFLGILHVSTFFVAALVCHGELAADRPAASHLTAYYLWLAVGGVLGGSFAGLVAPLIFNSFAEYPIAVVALCLLVPLRGAIVGRALRRPDLMLPVAVAVVVIGAAIALDRFGINDQSVQRTLIFGPAAVLAFAASARPLRFGLAIAALLLASSVPVGVHEDQLFAARDFFGVDRVTLSQQGTQHILYSGNIVHGAQNLDPSARDEPLTYYSKSGPLGDIFAGLTLSAGAHVSVIGLGAGSMACYSGPDQDWSFFEIDPLVRQIAFDPKLFTFMRDCAPAHTSVMLGDGRLSIASLPAHSQDMIVVDAFGSDVIPVNLITHEAISLYRSKLTSSGVLVFNISNQYVDLRSVLAREAEAAGMLSYVRDDGVITPTEAADEIFASTWMVMAPSRAVLSNLSSQVGWSPAIASPGTQLWTDDFSDIFSVLRWH
jgi:hypothetical protein